MLSMSINVIWLPVIAIICVILGFTFRSNQIRKCKKRILSLENEMLSNHAEILKLQQELVTLKKENLPTYKSRVVPMKDLPPEENRDAKDLDQRKKNVN